MLHFLQSDSSGSSDLSLWFESSLFDSGVWRSRYDLSAKLWFLGPRDWVPHGVGLKKGTGACQQ
jgi:hypothetical protein